MAVDPVQPVQTAAPSPSLEPRQATAPAPQRHPEPAKPNLLTAQNQGLQLPPPAPGTPRWWELERQRLDDQRLRQDRSDDRGRRERDDYERRQRDLDFERQRLQRR